MASAIDELAPIEIVPWIKAYKCNALLGGNAIFLQVELLIGSNLPISLTKCFEELDYMDIGVYPQPASYLFSTPPTPSDHNSVLLFFELELRIIYADHNDFLQDCSMIRSLIVRDCSSGS